MRFLERLQPLGLLAVRLVVGVIMIAHGYGKVFGGMQKYTEFIGSIGLPWWSAYLSAYAEFFGGILLVGGLLTRVVALAICIDMVVAVVKVNLKNGLIGKGGYEYPLTLAAVAFALIFFAAGPISLDWVFFRGGGEAGRK